MSESSNEIGTAPWKSRPGDRDRVDRFTGTEKRHPLCSHTVLYLSQVLPLFYLVNNVPLRLFHRPNSQAGGYYRVIKALGPKLLPVIEYFSLPRAPHTVSSMPIDARRRFVFLDQNTRLATRACFWSHPSRARDAARSLVLVCTSPFVISRSGHSGNHD